MQERFLLVKIPNSTNGSNSSGSNCYSCCRDDSCVTVSSRLVAIEMIETGSSHKHSVDRISAQVGSIILLILSDMSKIDLVSKLIS